MNYDHKPFLDYLVSDNTKIRVFDSSDTSEYVWHRDREDRIVKILDGVGWMFQFDNDLPFYINKGDEFFIPKMVFHRIIPGTTELKIKIREYHDEIIITRRNEESKNEPLGEDG